MQAEALTDREWFLMNLVQERTLEAVIDACARSGIPGRAVAELMLEIHRQDMKDGGSPLVRQAAEALLNEYKHGIGAAGGAS